MALTAKMVTIDCADPQRLVPFWTEATGYKVAADYGAFVLLQPSDGSDGIALGLQQVPEDRVGKNRVHVDWHSDDRPAEVERLCKLGASVLWEQSVPGLSWTTMADPDGNEFCVAG